MYSSQIASGVKEFSDAAPVLLFVSFVCTCLDSGDKVESLKSNSYFTVDKEQ